MASKQYLETAQTECAIPVMDDCDDTAEILVSPADVSFGIHVLWVIVSDPENYERESYAVGIP